MNCARCTANVAWLNDAGQCADCEPREGESCEAWLDRTRPLPDGCACTTKLGAPDAFASGFCKPHGVAWHARVVR